MAEPELFDDNFGEWLEANSFHFALSPVPPDDTFLTTFKMNGFKAAIQELVQRKVSAAKEEEDEVALMARWLKKVRAREEGQLTRPGRIEIRHTCLYAVQSLNQLRDDAYNDGLNSGHAIIAVKEVIAQLETLVKYLEGKGGGFSALTDRNKR